MRGRPRGLCLATLSVGFAVIANVSFSQTIANFANDYVAGANVGDTTASVGLPGTAGGFWNYYADDNGIIDGSEVLLTFSNAVGGTGFGNGDSGYSGTNDVFGSPDFEDFPIVTNGAVFTPNFTPAPPTGFLQVSPGDASQPDPAILAIEYRASSSLSNILFDYSLIDTSTDGNDDGIDYSIVQVINNVATQVLAPTLLTGAASTGSQIQSISNLNAGDSVWFLVDPRNAPNTDVANLSLEVRMGLPEIYLNVDTATGEIALKTTAAFSNNVVGYDLTSNESVGALNPNAWLSIAGNYDANSGPTGGVQVDANDNWTEFPSSRTSLAEAELNSPLGNGAQFPANLDLPLGNVWTKNPFGNDLHFELLLEDGTRQDVVVLYDESTSSNPLVLADYNNNGEIDAGDWPTVRDNFNADMSALSDAESYALGDLNRDGVNDIEDYSIFKFAYESDQGPGSFAALLAVPEPTTFLLLAICTLGLVHTRSRKCTLARA